jgi:3-oxoacyl-[acyl-carrier protein] reductase
VAVVTGAARGVGAAVAVGLAAAGLDIAAVDDDGAECGPTVDAVGRLGRRAVAAGSGDGMDAALHRVAERLGEPTVLVNVACPDPGPALSGWAVADWADRVETVLYGAFSASRAASDYMMRDWWGRIVTVAVGTVPTVTEALLGFTRTVALECEPFGIAVNAVVGQPSGVPDGDPFGAAVQAVSMLAGPDASGLSGQVLYVACGR